MTMRLRLLGTTGLRVGELCLGTMTFGEDWGWGADKKVSRKMFDAYVAAGGNFIDTANLYTDGTSEQYVGEFIADDRERFVVATKYSLSLDKSDPNASGNHRKSLVRSVENSLRRMKTAYIDLLWVHMWDGTTPVAEVMKNLEYVVASGKALHVGVSDTPAWVIAQANTIALERGWTPFSALQVPYHLARRDVERDLLPVAKAFGMSVTPWGILGAGQLTGKYNAENDEPKRVSEPKKENLDAAEVVMAVAQECGRTPAQVAINWVRQQEHRAQIIPILGARRLEQLEDDLACLEFELTAEQIERLEAASPFDSGFPHEFLDAPNIRELIFGEHDARLDRTRA